MRKIILYGIIIFQIALIASLVRGVQLSRKSSDRIDAMAQEKEKLEKQRDKLISEAEYVQSEFYIEKVAREELHLSKPGETVIIIPDSRLQIPEVGKNTQQQIEKPNWLKWWEVLAGK